MIRMLALRHLKGARVVLAGRFGYVSRAEAARLIRAQGGLVHGALSRRTTALVIGGLGVPIGRDGGPSPIIERAEALNTSGAAIRILSERVLLELTSRATPDRTLGGGHGADDVAQMLGIERRTLERWAQLGLIRSGHDFDFQDIVSLRTIAELIERGVDTRTIARTLVGLSRTLPDIQRPLSQLRILAESPHSLVVQLHDTLRTSEGQLLLSFDDTAPAEDAPATIPHTSPEVALEEALAAESEERFDTALRLYDSIIEHRPAWADAHFNRGNVLLATDQSSDAAEAYRRAVAIDPHHAPAWYNLSEAAERESDLDGAIAALRAALAADPTYADAMYNLATLLQHTGRLDDAALTWRRYLRLDTSSEWADHARAALASCTPSDPTRIGG